MPATNYTPIQLYRSTTSGAMPSNANLSPGEVALNIADNDMSMYFENASGTVKRFFNNPAELKYPTADGTSGQFLTTNGSGVLSFGSISAGALTNNTRQAVTSSATTTINLNSGNVIDLTMAASIATLSFTNVPASGTPILIQIVVKNASDATAYTIAWPNSVYWSGQYAAITPANVQTAPTLATGANGVIPPLGYESGQYYATVLNAAGSVPATANYTYYQPFYVGTTETWDRIAITTGAVTSTVRLGIYNASADGKPTTVLLDAGTVSTTTAGTYAITISLTLSPGWYFFAVNSSATTALAGGTTFTLPNGYLRYVPTVVGSATSGFQETGITGAFATAGTITRTTFIVYAGLRKA